jgi:hypothetical protein
MIVLRHGFGLGQIWAATASHGSCQMSPGVNINGAIQLDLKGALY